MTVRFDDAWLRSRGLADELAASGVDVVLSRDVVGRISLVVSGTDTNLDLAELSSRMTESAGPYAGAAPVLSLSDTGLSPEFFEPPRLVVLREREPGRGRLAIMEQGVVGADWRTIAEAPSTRRVTLYSYKGGVGRSTATVMLARELAERGRCVLVVDLDLESPGISSLLLTEETHPDHGLVDFLVESLVGNEFGLDLVTRSPLVKPSGNGEVWVAPAAGRSRDGYTYLPKLNRAYIDTPEHTFARRLDAAVTACETAVQKLSRPPDHVLLDSRAGIHDIAAVAITDLSDLSLLFATDSPQTWNGYRQLLGQWAVSPLDARTIRQRLRMVAAMVPSAREDAYLTSFRDHAQDCFARTVYDNAEPDDQDAYSPGVNDEAAPHSPLPILFSSELIGLDPTTNPDWHQSELVQAAYSEFVDTVPKLLSDGGE